jgi:hypothetical protein
VCYISVLRASATDVLPRPLASSAPFPRAVRTEVWVLLPQFAKKHGYVYQPVISLFFVFSKAPNVVLELSKAVEKPGPASIKGVVAHARPNASSLSFSFTPSVLCFTLLSSSSHPTDNILSQSRAPAMLMSVTNTIGQISGPPQRSASR